MNEKIKQLEEREKALEAREQELERREKALDPFSTAVQLKKEQWYSKVKLSVRQMNVIIWIVFGLLAVVVALIILEAAGIFKL